jgi:hypothetical protein
LSPDLEEFMDLPATYIGVSILDIKGF